MKMTKPLILSILCGSLAFSQVMTAEENAPQAAEAVAMVNTAALTPAQMQAEINAQNDLSDARKKDITPKSVDDFFNEFAEQHNISYGTVSQGKTFFTGKAKVTLPNTDPNFSKSLSLAFDKAMLDMQGSFVLDTFGKLISETERKVFRDESSNAREFPEQLSTEGKMTQLLNKVADLAGAQLDAALRNLGVDVPAGFTEQQKKDLVFENLIEDIRREAFGSMQGLVPIQTVVTSTGQDGHYEVGVIAVLSPKTRQMAEDIRRKRESTFKGRGKNIRDFIPAKNEDFINEYGIRMVYNENGSPVIISYGQWGFIPDKNGNNSANKKQYAQKQAIAKADAAISAFVNLSISAKDLSLTGEEIRNTITRIKQGGTTTDVENASNEILDKISSEITAKSSLSLNGIGTLKTWSFKDENGIEYVGAVRIYSYENVKNTNEILKSSQTKPNTQPNRQPNKAVDSSRQSRQINDLDDF